MQFLMIVKHRETQGRPPQELIDAVAKLGEKETRAGRMLAGGELQPTVQGARVRISGGKLTVTDGPFTEAKEVIGGYAQFQMTSMEEAVKATVGYMELYKKYWPGWEGEIEVREMCEPGAGPMSTES